MASRFFRSVIVCIWMRIPIRPLLIIIPGKTRITKCWDSSQRSIFWIREESLIGTASVCRDIAQRHGLLCTQPLISKKLTDTQRCLALPVGTWDTSAFLRLPTAEGGVRREPAHLQLAASLRRFDAMP